MVVVSHPLQIVVITDAAVSATISTTRSVVYSVVSWNDSSPPSVLSVSVFVLFVRLRRWTRMETADNATTRITSSVVDSIVEEQQVVYYDIVLLN